MEMLNRKAYELYFEQFHPSVLAEIKKDEAEGAKGDPYRKKFSDLYARNLGWRAFTAPNLILIFAIFVSILWVAGGAVLFPSLVGEQDGLPQVAVAAVLGAYMWSLSDFTTKSQSVFEKGIPSESLA